MNYLKQLLLTFLMGGILVSCKTAEEVIPGDPQKLTGTWRLVDAKVQGPVFLTFRSMASVTPPYDSGKGFFVETRASEGTNSGFASASTASFGSTLLISLTNPVTTAPTDPEAAYLIRVQAVRRYELTNQNRLRLFYETPAQGMLTYERVRQ